MLVVNPANNINRSKQIPSSNQVPYNSQFEIQNLLPPPCDVVCCYSYLIQQHLFFRSHWSSIITLSPSTTWGFWEDFDTTLGQLWDNFGTTLGQLRNNFGTTLRQSLHWRCVLWLCGRHISILGILFQRSQFINISWNHEKWFKVFKYKLSSVAKVFIVVIAVFGLDQWRQVAPERFEVLRKTWSHVVDEGENQQKDNNSGKHPFQHELLRTTGLQVQPRFVIGFATSVQGLFEVNAFQKQKNWKDS